MPRILQSSLYHSKWFLFCNSGVQATRNGAFPSPRFIRSGQSESSLLPASHPPTRVCDWQANLSSSQKIILFMCQRLIFLAFPRLSGPWQSQRLEQTWAVDLKILIAEPRSSWFPLDYISTADLLHKKPRYQSELFSTLYFLQTLYSWAKRHTVSYT